MILLHTTGRILRQLRHDRRTVAMLIVVPTLLLTLLYFMFDGQDAVFDPSTGSLRRAVQPPRSNPPPPHPAAQPDHGERVLGGHRDDNTGHAPRPVG